MHHVTVFWEELCHKEV